MLRQTPSPCAGWPHCTGMGRVRAAWGSVVSHSSHDSTLINSRRSVSALLSNPSSLGHTAQSGFTCTCQDALSFLIHLPAQTTLYWLPVIHTPISTCKSPAPPYLSICLSVCLSTHQWCNGSQNSRFGSYYGFWVTDQIIFWISKKNKKIKVCFY